MFLWKLKALDLFDFLLAFEIINFISQSILENLSWQLILNV